MDSVMIPVAAPGREAAPPPACSPALGWQFMMHEMKWTRVSAGAVPGGGRWSRRTVAVWLGALVGFGAACAGGPLDGGTDRTVAGAEPREQARPNIVWIVADALDGASVGGGFGGVRAVAAETAAVASDPAPARAMLLTGLRPATLGLDGAGGRLVAPPPAGVTVLPERLRRAGYYTSRAGPPRHNLASSRSAPVEVVHVDGGVHEAVRARPVPIDDLAQPGLLGAWDAAGADADWRGRDKDWESPCTVSFGCGGARSPGARPFFALFNLDPQAAGRGADSGRQVARIVAALEADGLLEDTVVFLIGARGPSPTVAIRWPARIAGAAEAETPVSLLDLAPTALALAGVPAPAYMEGRALIGPNGHAPPAQAAAATPAERNPRSDPGIAASAPEMTPVAATPGGYPTGGLFHVAPRVDLRCGTEGSTIVYTTEHEAPFHWRLYDGPFRMRFWTLRFQCGRLGYRDSDVVTYDFDIE